MDSAQLLGCAECFQKLSINSSENFSSHFE